MMFLRSWLEDYLTLKNLTDQEIALAITSHSSEVEEVRVIHDYFDGKVLVGLISDVQKHPNADRLLIFSVNLGKTGKVQVISAAPNVRDGLIVPIAVPNCKLANITIGKRNVYGIESQGMCCGKSELFLETPISSGIWELNEFFPDLDYNYEFVFGQSICELLPDYFPPETLFDIKVLPNRISEIGHHAGMALDLSYILGQDSRLTSKGLELRDPEELSKRLLGVLSEVEASKNPIEVRDEIDLAKSFLLFQIEFEKEYILPHEWQKRMYITGRNLIGGVADLTNYFLGDFGHPTHVFGGKELQKVNDSGNWVIDKVVTPATFSGLGLLKEVVLPIGTPVLYQQQNPEIIYALPGISGGELTKTSEDATSCVLEIANFEAEDISRASFTLKYRSEGSRIWSGGVNLPLLAYCVYRFVNHLSDLGKINFAFGLIKLENSVQEGDLETVRLWLLDLLKTKTRHQVDTSYISRRIDGRKQSEWDSKIKSILSRLGVVEGEDFQPNIFFSNLKTQNDLYEEVVRLSGLEKLGVQNRRLSTENQQMDYRWESVFSVRQLVKEYDFVEVITRPFVDSESILSAKYEPIRVLKPYNSTVPFVRDNLTFSLLQVLSENILRGEKNPSLFEVNTINQLVNGTLHTYQILGAVAIGDDPYRFTSLLDSLERRFSQNWKIIETEDYFGKKLGKVVGYSIDDRENAEVFLIQVDNRTKKLFEIPLNKNVWVIHVPLPEEIKPFAYRNYSDESLFPSVNRSYSWAIDRNIKWESIKNRIKEISELSDIKITLNPQERLNSGEFDILNYDIVYRRLDRTLTGEEIEKFENDIFVGLSEYGNFVKR